jgi:hypothetical protein
LAKQPVTPNLAHVCECGWTNYPSPTPINGSQFHVDWRVPTSCARCGMEQLALSLPPGHDGQRNQERHNAHGTDDVRRHGKRTGDIARVRPDQADNRAHDEQSDHRG